MVTFIHLGVTVTVTALMDFMFNERMHVPTNETKIQLPPKKAVKSYNQVSYNNDDVEARTKLAP